MLFSSATFIFVFLPLVLLFYYTIFRKSRKWQNIFLTLSSLFFYAWGEPWFVIIMMGSIFVNWGFGLLVDKKRNHKTVKIILACMVVMNLGVMFIFKYLSFSIKNINSIFGNLLPNISIALPIGISFFTFQAMSYVIDVYRKKGDAQKNPLNVALYIAFFPQLIAGPIVRYETIAEQIKYRKENFNDFSDGLCRFVVGLGKKVLIANSIAVVADRAFAADERSILLAWLGALAYTFQIFFDFSGYSDMAIGLGKMFGFSFLENFDFPYKSKSITEFWRRWHISLGTWFRDYLYFPLGGSKVKTKRRLVFNLFVVWLLTGLWHGANWTFIIWGLMYFALITLEKLTGFDKKLKNFAYVYTLLFVIIGWVLFRADSVYEAFKYMGNMFGIGSVGFAGKTFVFWLSEYSYVFIFAIILSFPVGKLISDKFSNYKLFKIAYPILMTILLLITIMSVVSSGYSPFIYFNF